MSLICQPLGAVNPGLGAPRQVDGRTADGRPGRRCGADPPQTWTSGSQLLGAPWGQKNDGVEHPKSVSTLPRPKSCVFKEELYTKMWSRRTRDFLLIFGGIQAGAPDGSRWLQMAPDGSRMAPDGSRWLQMAPEGSRGLQMPPGRLQMTPDGSRWLQMAPDDDEDVDGEGPKVLSIYIQTPDQPPLAAAMLYYICSMFVRCWIIC